MKNIIAFTFALSALATSAAFASPQSTASVAPAGHVAATSEQALHVAQASVGKSSSGFKQALDSGVVVAETRPEFGSQYQRY